MPDSPASRAETRRRFAAWSLLLLPFLVLLLVAGGHERAAWPDFLPGEATVLMQAGSLIEDGDLLYTRLDFDRLLLAWRGNPPDLELATGGDGRRITYHRPALYAAYLAPFLALAPERGIAFANIALLLAAALAAARVLAGRLGLWGPPLVAIWLFASVAFTGVFRADGDVFALSLVLLAATCVLAASEGEAAGTSRLALAAGALLAPVFLAQPLALLLLPLFAYWPAAAARRRLAPPLWLGAALGALLLVLVQWWNGGGLYFAAASSFTFTPATGYPAVDFAPADWAKEVQQLAALHWDGAPRFSWGFEPRLAAWNLVYFLAGAQLGVLPYLLPLALLLALARPRPLLLAAAATMVLLLVIHPFNFWDGPGPLGNRALLPLYGAAILFLPALRSRLAGLAGGRAVLAGIAPLLLAAPFLFLLWRMPAEWPYAKASYLHQTTAARALLPHEASQRWLPGGAIEELDAVWIAALDAHSWVEKRHGRLGIEGQHAAFLVSSSQPLSALLLELGEGAPNELTVRGGRLGDRILRADGGIAFRVEPELWRHHALWFSPLPMYIYRLELELPPGREGETLFRMVPEWPAGEER